ncbi:structural protein [Sulfolobus polyhedral virus 3]|nr:structural protein [Sulfolobus polyhedral virus 3]
MIISSLTAFFNISTSSFFIIPSPLLLLF